MPDLLHNLQRMRDRDLHILILEGDARLWMPLLPPDFFSLTITDFPYESLERHRAKGTTTRLKNSKSSSNPWFSVLRNPEYYSVMRELYRVQKYNTHCRIFCDSETEHVILSGRNPYDDKLDTAMIDAPSEDMELERPIDQGGWRAWPSWTWIKTKVAVNTDEANEELTDEMVRSGMGYHGRRSHERILFLEKGKLKIQDASVKDVLCGPRAGKNDYPTKKPLEVLRPLVRASASKLGGMLLDPFAGSGNVAIAALEHGLRCVLIDLDITEIMETVASIADANISILRKEDLGQQAACSRGDLTC